MVSLASSIAFSCGTCRNVDQEPGDKWQTTYSVVFLLQIRDGEKMNVVAIVLGGFAKITIPKLDLTVSEGAQQKRAGHTQDTVEVLLHAQAASRFSLTLTLFVAELPEDRVKRETACRCNNSTVSCV